MPVPAQNALILGIGLTLALGPSSSSCAEPQPGETVAPPAADLEREIAGLTAPDLLTNRPFDLAGQISALEDLAAQERLHGLLNARMEALNAEASSGTPMAPAVTPEVGTGSVAGMTTGELAGAVEQLTLGPQATADDLRHRDALVSRIAQLTDPVERDQLLQRLDARERQAEAPPSTLSQPE